MTNTVDRRNFIRRGAITAVGLGLASPLLKATGLGATRKSPRIVRRALVAAEPVVVSVNLFGGNDYLNTVMDLSQYDLYSGLRPQTGIGGGEFLPLNGQENIVLNPGMAVMQSLYNEGKVAIIPGVGLPASANGKFDHEASQLNFQTGYTAGTGLSSEPTGWLGRWVSDLGGGMISRGVDFGGGAFVLATGDDDNPPLSVSDLSSLHIDTSLGATRETANYATIQGMRVYGDNVAAERARAVRAQALSMSRIIAEQTASYEPMAEYPSSGLGTALRQCAQLLTSPELGVRALSVGTGGFDTHADQRALIEVPGSGPVPYHDLLLGGVSNAAAAFLADLEAQDPELAGRVLLVVFSEFGRRPLENVDRGTDHGYGGGMFVLGSPNLVNGGVHGSYPGLDQASLVEDGNLAAPIDFRRVYATILANFLGVDPNDVLPGGPFELLDFV